MAILESSSSMNNSYILYFVRGFYKNKGLFEEDMELMEPVSKAMAKLIAQ